MNNQLKQSRGRFSCQNPHVTLLAQKTQWVSTAETWNNSYFVNYKEFNWSRQGSDVIGRETQWLTSTRGNIK